MPELHSGYITIRLAERFLPLLGQGKDLRALAREAGALDLASLLDDYSNCGAEPLVSSVEPLRLLELEKTARERGLDPGGLVRSARSVSGTPRGYFARP